MLSPAGRRGQPTSGRQPGERDPPVGDERGERAWRGEDDGEVPARREAGEAVEAELREVGAERGGGGQLGRHLAGRPRRGRHADERPRARDGGGGGRGRRRHRHRRGHRGGW